MTENSSLESKIDALSKKIDSQARFTRSVVLLCTTAIVGVVLYIFTEVMSTIPASLLEIYASMGKASHQGGAHLPKTQTKSTLSPPQAIPQGAMPQAK